MTNKYLEKAAGLVQTVARQGRRVMSKGFSGLMADASKQGSAARKAVIGKDSVSHAASKISANNEAIKRYSSAMKASRGEERADYARKYIAEHQLLAKSKKNLNSATLRSKRLDKAEQLSRTGAKKSLGTLGAAYTVAGTGAVAGIQKATKKD